MLNFLTGERRLRNIRDLGRQFANQAYDPSVMAPQRQAAERQASQGIDTGAVRGSALSQLGRIQPDMDMYGGQAGRGVGMMGQQNLGMARGLVDMETQLGLADQQARMQGRQATADIQGQQAQIGAQREAAMTESDMMYEAEVSSRRQGLAGTAIGLGTLAGMGAFPGLKGGALKLVNLLSGNTSTPEGLAGNAGGDFTEAIDTGASFLQRQRGSQPSMFNLDIDPLDLGEADPAFMRSALSGVRGQQSTTAVARQGAAPQAQTPTAPEVAPMAQNTREFVRGGELPSYLFRENIPPPPTEQRRGRYDDYEPEILKGRAGRVIEAGTRDFFGAFNPSRQREAVERSRLEYRQRQRAGTDFENPMFNWFDLDRSIQSFADNQVTLPGTDTPRPQRPTGELMGLEGGESYEPNISLNDVPVNFENLDTPQRRSSLVGPTFDRANVDSVLAANNQNIYSAFGMQEPSVFNVGRPYVHTQVNNDEILDNSDVDLNDVEFEGQFIRPSRPTTRVGGAMDSSFTPNVDLGNIDFQGGFVQPRRPSVGLDLEDSGMFDPSVSGMDTTFTFDRMNMPANDQIQPENQLSFSPIPNTMSSSPEGRNQIQQPQRGRLQPNPEDVAQLGRSEMFFDEFPSLEGFGRVNLTEGREQTRSFEPISYPDFPDIYRGSLDFNDFNPSQFDSIAARTQRDLQQFYGTDNIEVRMSDRKRSMQNQREALNRGFSQTPVSLHNIGDGLAQDYQIYIDGELATGNNRFGTEPYQVLGKNAMDEGMFWGWGWDSGHVGVTRFTSDLIHNNPEVIRDDPQFKEFFDQVIQRGFAPTRDRNLLRTMARIYGSEIPDNFRFVGEEDQNPPDELLSPIDVRSTTSRNRPLSQLNMNR
jgi:hypothetical protein